MNHYLKQAKEFLEVAEKEFKEGKAKKNLTLVIVHQAWKNCGFGAEIACKVMEYSFDYLDAPIKRIAGLDTPMPYARTLEEVVLPGEADIIEGIRSLVRI